MKEPKIQDLNAISKMTECSDYTTKLQSSRQYGSDTNTEL